VAACLASAAIVWLHFYTSQSFMGATDTAASPDFFIENPVWRQFNGEGTPSRQLHAERLEQWPGEPGARLQEPRLMLVDAHRERWHASARSGHVSETPSALVLKDQVKLVREPENGGLVLDTEQLRITGRGDLIETDQPVVLKSRSWHVSAEAFRAEPERQQLQLLGNVRGIHE
jgi:LPS export ABC transporter protein LptC